MTIATHRIGRVVVRDYLKEDRIEIEIPIGEGRAVIKHADVDDLIHALCGIANAPRWRRAEEPGAEAGLIAVWLRRIAVDGAIQDADKAQLEAIADAVLEQRYLEDPRAQFVGEDVTSTGVGPVTVEVSRARANGWSEAQIARCVALVGAASRMENLIAAEAQGHTRICPACEQWTVPVGECHLCKADRDSVAAREVLEKLLLEHVAK